MFLGIDIGGTKTAVCTADNNGKILDKIKFETTDWRSTLDRVITEGRKLLGGERPKAIGISCGSPQDAKTGMILEPPNLPGWVDVPVCKMMSEAFLAPARLMNDANACALAEWRFGAGKGTKNMVFLTFGTGMGAGVILDGRLYEGTTESAGEVGHMRLEKEGPTGYGKAGSFEGFCSGGGIKQLGIAYAKEALDRGLSPAYARSASELDTVSAKTIADAAHAGDETALKVYKEVSKRLGQGLSVIMDLYNPEAIVIGSIFVRAEDLLREAMEAEIQKEALSKTSGVCRVLPAALGEALGDYAAIAVAMQEHDSLFARYPSLTSCKDDIEKACEMLINCAKNNGLIMTCGNGGSASDSEHIVGELMKGFTRKRPLPADVRARYEERFGTPMPMLQQAVRAISLPSQIAVLSAFANDVTAEDVYAQLAYGYASEGDVLIAMSTSGNSKNCVSAAKAALIKGAKVIALTGEKDSELSKISDVTIQVPETETYKVQELHLPVYHKLCLAVEESMFD